MPIRSIVTIFLAVTIVGAACNARGTEEIATLAASPLRPSTIPATQPPPPSETSAPPPQPTRAPVDGVTSTRVNVRSEPSTAGSVLGIIPGDSRVDITGKDPGENWWQINYPAGPNGKGWVTAQYVVTANKDLVPVVGGAGMGREDGPLAIVQQQLHVRSGPGTGFNSLGTLSAQDVLTLLGKDPDGAWLQIDYPAGPDGKGWVNAAFVQAQGVENLPIVTDAGLVVGTGTPTQVPPTPTATIVPAWEDDDSASNPVASVLFEPAGTQTLIYQGDISSPEGDPQDWVAFTPYGSAVFASLRCRGEASIQVNVTENGQPAEMRIECGAPLRRFAVKPGAQYIVYLRAAFASDHLQYASYVLTIKTRP